MALQFELNPPTLFRPTLEGFILLWRTGMEAVRANMTYATHAVDAGLPLDSFAQIGRARTVAALLSHRSHEALP